MSELVEVLDWDTEFWGVRAGRVHAVDQAQLIAAEHACSDLHIEWASLLVPTTDVPLINAAVTSGYKIVDVRFTLSTILSSGSSLDPAAIGGAGDADELAHVARTALRESRFFADEHLDDVRCADFYETWIRNSVTGEMADVVLVARSSAGIDGFITVRLGAGGSASLPLVAVRTDRQGTGVGRRLVATTLDWISAQGATRTDVVTQLTNRAAIRLYESSGFRFHESAVWLHRWWT
jgi:dTDP-4-amino-4,6-dideoxy-D-galactose acyltransferase